MGSIRKHPAKVGSIRSSATVCLFILLVLLIPFEKVFGGIITVCPGGGCNFSDIESALNNASANDEIRVAGGIYTQGFSVRSSHASPLTISGGWNPAFTVQDPDQYETILQGASIAATENNGQDVTIERLTITAGYQGIYAYNTQPSGRTLLKITLRNLKIYGNSSSGIYLRNIDTATIEDCQVYNNGSSYGAVTIWEHQQVTVRNNTIHSNTQALGLEITNAKSGDVISGNWIYGNKSGLSIQGAGAAPIVTGNRVNHNAGDGLIIQYMTPDLRNNVIHHNGGHGALIPGLQGNAVIRNNTFAYNEGNGIKFDGGNGTPVINNNIFAYNFRGMEFISGFWGASAIRPVSLKNNCFAGSQAPQLFFIGSTDGSFNAEEGSYGNLNDIRFPDEPDTGFSLGNFIETPGFADPEDGDFSLLPNSYLIDEGEPSDPFGNEPNPNGARVNVGGDGNTAQASPSPAPPAVANVKAEVSGPIVAITFDTNTATEKLRIRGEYYDTRDSTWKPFTIGSGLTSGRMASGPSRQVTWDASLNVNPGEKIEHCQVRITAAHGNDSAAAESSEFTIDFTQPAIKVIPDLLEVWTQEGVNAFSTAFQIKNAGGQEPAYSLSIDQNWMTVEPAGGNLNIAGDTMALRFDTISLPAGDHQGQMTITAPGVTNSPLTVPVVAHISPCTYSLGSLGQTVGAEGSWGNVMINADGGCAWQLESDQPWLVFPWGDSGNGSGIITWQAGANAGRPRTAIITVTGIHYTGTFAVYQDGVAPSQFSVTVLGEGTAAGTVTSNLGGIQYHYPAVDSGETAPLDQGTQILVTAVAETGAVATWGGTCSAAGGSEAGNNTGTAVCTITLTGNLPITASFMKIPENNYGITINSGDLFTNAVQVKLSLEAESGTALMQISNEENFSGTAWEPFNSRKDWQLIGDGDYAIPRVVYVRFKKLDGTLTAVYQDDIILDVTPPQGSVHISRSDSGAVSVPDRSFIFAVPAAAGGHKIFLPSIQKPPQGTLVRLELNATDDVSGVSQMMISNHPDFSGGQWESFQTRKDWDLFGSTVFVKLKDQAGNVSEIYSASSR